MLAHRLRRRPNIKTGLSEPWILCFLFFAICFMWASVHVHRFNVFFSYFHAVPCEMSGRLVKYTDTVMFMCLLLYILLLFSGHSMCDRLRGDGVHLDSHFHVFWFFYFSLSISRLSYVRSSTWYLSTPRQWYSSIFIFIILFPYFQTVVCEILYGSWVH